MMKFKEYKNKNEFLAENEFDLQENEDINNTMLGIISQDHKEKIYFRIENNNNVELIGIITKTERKGLMVYIKNLDISIEVYELLINEIISRKIELKEIRAPKGIVDILFNLYSQNVEVKLKSTKDLYLMKLKKLPQYNERSYVLRKADANDLEFEKKIAYEIASETLGIEINEDKAFEMANTYIQNGLYFLTDESREILCQASTTKETKNGYKIGAVYTPKDKRRNGYAKECLYKVINRIKNENKEIIVLYSNVTKIQNRRLYESLGFEIILEERIIKF